MTDFAFTPPATVSLAIANSGKRYPVRRIYCIGRNYEAHVREMGHDPDRSPPIYFCKPTDSVVEIPFEGTGYFPYPVATENCHHEIELVIAIGKGGRNIAPNSAADHIFGYAIGVDMTRRDLQRAAAQAGQPWETGKAFDSSAPIGPVHSKEETGEITSGAISLSVNGMPRQSSDLSNLIWDVNEIISSLSQLFELQPGDLIFTGTPEGVGSVDRGDTMTCSVAGLGELSIQIR